MRPRKRFNYVYVVQNLYLYNRDYIWHCAPPSLTDMNVYTCFEDAKKTLNNYYNDWCNQLVTTRTNIKVKKPSSVDAGSYYVNLGGYRVDYINDRGQHRTRVGKLFRYRL